MPTPTPTNNDFCPDDDGSNELQVPPDAGVADDNRNPRRRQRREQGQDVGILVEPGERDTFANLVIYPDCTTDILAGLRSIQLRAEFESVWNIGRIQPQQGRCILNFYGPPGTGKTRAARAIAARLGKPLYQVDYSAVISKYLGDTAKHIVQAFKRAKEEGATPNSLRSRQSSHPDATQADRADEQVVAPIEEAEVGFAVLAPGKVRVGHSEDQVAPLPSAGAVNDLRMRLVGARERRARIR
jgi:hypothetical protein